MLVQYNCANGRLKGYLQYLMIYLMDICNILDLKCDSAAAASIWVVVLKRWREPLLLSCIVFSCHSHCLSRKSPIQSRVWREGVLGELMCPSYKCPHTRLPQGCWDKGQQYTTHAMQCNDLNAVKKLALLFCDLCFMVQTKGCVAKNCSFKYFWSNTLFAEASWNVVMCISLAPRALQMKEGVWPQSDMETWELGMPPHVGAAYPYTQVGAAYYTHFPSCLHASRMCPHMLAAYSKVFTCIL